MLETVMPNNQGIDAKYLENTDFFNFDHPAVKQFVQKALESVDSDNPIEQAKALYQRARDSVSYNPYVFSSSPETFSASYILESGRSYCIPKAVLLGAAARSIGIPSRLGLADVKNHVSSPQLIEYLQSDIFRMHGYIELHLNGRWVKATPAFDAKLSKHMKVAPLEFDGINDSIFHEFTESGDQHMEYINDHGTFADVPLEFIIGQIKTHYSHLFNEQGNIEHKTNASLEKDIS